MKISFGPFTLDSGRRRLSSADRKIPLSPKAFNLLCLLAERRPDVVDKETLLRQIWPDTVVIEANLNVLISEIRGALLDDPKRPKFIHTSHAVGFAFCGDATDLEPRTMPGKTERSRFWLAWNERTFVLAEGDNVIGRDPNCSVWLDGAGISRQHARIRVDSAARLAVVDDLGSTNGTYVQRARVTSGIALTDGDTIKVGALELKFRAWSEDTPRPTERIRRVR